MSEQPERDEEQILPPPRMSMPVLRGAACTASSFMARTSATKSRIRPGDLKVWKYSMSPMEPSVMAGLYMGMPFLAAQ